MPHPPQQTNCQSTKFDGDGNEGQALCDRRGFLAMAGAGLAAASLGGCLTAGDTNVRPPGVEEAAGPAEFDVYDRQGQARRRQALIESFTAERVDMFNDKGQWLGDPIDISGWTGYMYMTPFLMSGNAKAIRRANAMIEAGQGSAQDLAVNLVTSRHLLTDAAAARMEANTRRLAKEQFPSYTFSGDNDNIPLMAAAVIAMWGVYADDKDSTALAIERLGDFKKVLMRRGLQSEFTSPGYTAMQINPVAQIVEYARDPRLRRLAYDIETRIWIDILGHYHFPSQTISGAYSRAYNVFFLSGSFVRMNVGMVLGQEVVGDWQEGWRAIGLEFYLRRAVNKACVPYHCPSWLAKWALNRRYPFYMQATADGAPTYFNTPPGEPDIHVTRPKGPVGKDDDMYEYPAWHARVVNYQTADYSIGTSSRMFNAAETHNSFTVNLPYRKPLKSQTDTVRIFSRYVVNEETPFVSKLTERPNKGAFLEFKTDQIDFPDMGRAFALQHEKTAMVLYHPRVHVARKVTSMKCMVCILNEDFGRGGCRGDEIYIGDVPVRDFRGASAEPAPVFVRLGESYMALVPLILNDRAVPLVRKAALRVRLEGKTLGVSFYNYEGEALDLDRRQCSVIGNGFVCEMGSKSEDGTFAAFRRRFDAVEIRDSHGGGLNTRGARRRVTVFRRPGLELAMEYNQASEGIRYATINGKVAPEPQLSATGLPLDKVPWV
jgi:hypothetical protein